MSEAEASELDPREELALLAASTRALLEQYEASGADVVPSDAGALKELVTRQAPERDVPARDVPARDAPAVTLREAAPAREVVPAREPAVPRDVPRAPVAPAPASTPVASAPIATAPAASAPIDASSDDRRMRLALLAEEVRPCQKCVLCETRTQTVFARGNPFAELCFVGEGPGADEDAQGEPFVGRAGQLLDRMIVAMGYKRDEVYICNIVKCRPPNNRKPEPAEMAACASYLRDQLALVKPKVIVALGATAVTGLIGTTEGITRMRGNWKLYKGTIPIMPTFHPAYLLRDPSKKRDVWNDLQEVMKHLGRPVPKASADRDRGEG